MTIAEVSKDIQIQDAIHAVLIDDHETVFTQVAKALGAGDTILFHKYRSLSMLEKSSLDTVHVCIVDAYFRDEQVIGYILSIIENKWPLARVIVLSNYADWLADDSVHGVDACIPKPDFLLSPSLLRTAVMDSISRNKNSHSDVRRRAVEALMRTERESWISRDKIKEVRCGQSVYPFREEADVLYNGDQYTLVPLEGVVEGRGRTLSAAHASFAGNLHLMFQRLYVQAHSPSTSEQDQRWSILKSIVDLERYEQLRRIVVPLELGTVTSVAIGESISIQWNAGKHGGEVNVIELKDVPEGLARLTVGDCFRATVERMYRSKKLVRVVEASRIEKFNADVGKRRNFWQNLRPCADGDNCD